MKLGKACPKCGLDEWIPRDDGASGFRCMTCRPVQRNAARRRRYAEDADYRQKTRATARTWAQRHQEQRKKNSKGWYYRNRAWVLGPEQFLPRMLSRTRSRCARLGISFDLALSDLMAVWGDRCPYLGTPWAPGPCAPSLDRIVPSLGYVKGNVEVVSRRANWLKSDGTAAEHFIIANRLRGLEERILSKPKLEIVNG